MVYSLKKQICVWCASIAREHGQNVNLENKCTGKQDCMDIGIPFNAPRGSMLVSLFS